MATKRLRRPRDPIAQAKLVGDIATKQIEDCIEDARNPAAVQLDSLGGQTERKGAGKKKLTAAQRREIAQKAAQKRWSRK